MQLDYNINFAMAGMVVDIMAYANMRMQNGKDHSDIVFRRTIIVVFLSTFFDVLTAITNTYYEAVPHSLNMVLNTVVFATVSLHAFLITYYMVIKVEISTRKEVYFANTMFAPAALHMILLAINFFMKKGFMFYIDGEGYHHGPMFYLTYVIVSYYFVAGIYTLIVYRKTIKRVHRIAMGMFAFVNILGIILQGVFFPDFLLISFMTSMGLLPVMFTMESPDYRALVKTMKELDKANARANAANHTRTEFLASVTHELRTPLQDVINENSLILRDAESEEIRLRARHIGQVTKKLLDRSDDILDVSMAENGKIEILNVEYRLKNLINDCYLLVVDKMDEKGIRFKLECDRNLPRALMGDVVHIKQAVVNLLNNAVEFTDRGYITLIVSGERSGGKLMLNLAVKDTGVGLSKEELTSIFSGDRATLPQNEGLDKRGLGLPICKNLVEQMGGALDYKSIKKVGSLFSILLPQDIVENDPVGSFEIGVDKNGKNLFEFQKALYAPEARILVVDDVEANIKVVKGILKDSGIRIDAVRNGEDALKKVTKFDYDVIIMDHMMPNMDGIETYRMMRKSSDSVKNGLPVILCTANSLIKVQQAYFSEGFADIIAKPIRGDELERMLIRYIPEEKQKES